MTGFSINTNILDTNIINLIVVLGIVFYIGRDFLTSLLDNRQKLILANLTEADAKYNVLLDNLKETEEQLKKAQTEAMAIRSQSQQSIQTNVEKIMSRALEEQKRLKADKEFTLAREKIKIGNEIYHYMVDAALKQAQINIKRGLVSENTIHKRVNDRNISLLQMTN